MFHHIYLSVSSSLVSKITVFVEIFERDLIAGDIEASTVRLMVLDLTDGFHFAFRISLFFDCTACAW